MGNHLFLSHFWHVLFYTRCRWTSLRRDAVFNRDAFILLCICTFTHTHTSVPMSWSTCCESSVFVSVPEIPVYLRSFQSPIFLCLERLSPIASNLALLIDHTYLLLQSMSLSLAIWSISQYVSCPPPPASSIFSFGVLWDLHWFLCEHFPPPPSVTVTMGPRCASSTWLPPPSPLNTHVLRDQGLISDS